MKILLLNIAQSAIHIYFKSIIMVCQRFRHQTGSIQHDKCVCTYVWNKIVWKCALYLFFSPICFERTKQTIDRHIYNTQTEWNTCRNQNKATVSKTNWHLVNVMSSFFSNVNAHIMYSIKFCDIRLLSAYSFLVHDIFNCYASAVNVFKLHCNNLQLKSTLPYCFHLFML